MRKDGLKDLDLYPTDELVDEVLKRSNMGVFSAVYPIDGNPDKRDYVWNYMGNPIMCSGLAIELAHKITKEHIDLQEEDDEGRTAP